MTSPSPCIVHGCPELTTDTRCPEHAVARQRARYARRRAEGSPTYDSVRWRKFRKAYLRSVGWRCEDCGDRPADTSNLHVHHIIEIRDGGAMFDRENVRANCAACHNRAHGQRETKPMPPPPERERRVWGL